MQTDLHLNMFTIYLFFFLLFLLDLFNVILVWFNLRNILDHLIFINIILPISRLPLVTTYLDIYTYFKTSILVAHNFCFSEKVKQKKVERER